jgi:crossover junction endodeoxyribonuclease RusA
MNDKLTVVIDIPDKRLSPNKPVASRGARFGKANATKKQRTQAKKVCKVKMILAGIHAGDWQKATMTATFYHTTNRRRDGVNSLGMLKGAVDGVIDAGLLPDDDWLHLEQMPPRFEVDKERPRVEMTFERVE